jgi:hypothetical protein
MTRFRRTSLTAFRIALALGLVCVSLSRAQDAHKHEHGVPVHGGKLVMTRQYQFEVVFAPDGVNIYTRTHDDKPIDASRLTGTATFYHPSLSRPWFERKLVPPTPGKGQATSSIGLRIDLNKVPARGAKVAFRVEGLPDPAESAATFTVPFALADKVAISVGKVTKADEKAIAAQKVCPVSGEELGGEMGPPIKVSRGESAIFLCCKNCLKQVQANPDKFFDTSAASPHAAGHGQHTH